MESKELVAKILNGMDPWWYPLIVQRLAETHPDIFQQVFNETVDHNAVKNVEKYNLGPCCTECGKMVFKLPWGGWRHVNPPETEHAIEAVTRQDYHGYGNSGTH